MGGLATSDIGDIVNLVEEVEFKRGSDRRFLHLNPPLQLLALLVEMGLIGRIFAEIEAQHALAQVKNARLHMFREMKALALHRAKVFPQVLQLLPGGIPRPSDQGRQQSNRHGEAV